MIRTPVPMPEHKPSVYMTSSVVSCVLSSAIPRAVALSILLRSVNILIERFRSVACRVVLTTIPSPRSSLVRVGAAGGLSLWRRLTSGLHFGARASISLFAVSRHFCGCVQPRPDAFLHAPHVQKFVSRCSAGTDPISSASCPM